MKFRPNHFKELTNRTIWIDQNSNRRWSYGVYNLINCEL